ncbi:MAG: helix-turn-helix domain-containing protein [Candidatus Omnitrophica bacterium]|nr:helix-turn-helix domain-containing protein [Candidatus Omnitrophota bacterium]
MRNSDLQRYIDKRKKRSKRFAKTFDRGYKEFKIGVMLRMAREKEGLTQKELAEKMNTYKGAISRLENHAEDIKLSTLEKTAEALGRRLEIRIA